jgi:uncharacterized protein (TIGR02246 family)
MAPTLGDAAVEHPYTEIRALVERYADAINRRDAQAYRETWASDAVWEIRGQRYTGREAIMAYWEPLMAGIPWVLQTINNGTVDLDGDVATCRWFHTDFALLPDGTARMAIGLYNDICSRTEGRWLFQHREYTRMAEIPLGAGVRTFSHTGQPMP